MKEPTLYRRITAITRYQRYVSGTVATTPINPPMAMNVHLRMLLAAGIVAGLGRRVAIALTDDVPLLVHHGSCIDYFAVTILLDGHFGRIRLPIDAGLIRNSAQTVSLWVTY